MFACEVPLNSGSSLIVEDVCDQDMYPRRLVETPDTLVKRDCGLAVLK